MPTPPEEGPRKIRRVRRVAVAPQEAPKEGPPEDVPAGKGAEGKQPWREGARPPDDEPPEGYRFVRVPPIEGEPGGDASLASLRQQVGELYNDFVEAVALTDDTFRQFMLWAAETEGVRFQDLLIATRSLFEIMGRPLPGDKRMWNEFKEMANLVEITTVSDSELEYALEVFSKTFDLYKDELRRLDSERQKAESLSTQKISDEILAEDEGLLGGAGPEGAPPDGDQQPQQAAPAKGAAAAEATPEWEAIQPATKAPGPPAVTRTEAPAPRPAPPSSPTVAPAPPRTDVPETEPVEGERWEKVVDDTRSKINSTKAELDELSEELTPSKAERDAAISRLRVLEKDANRKRARLEWFQRGRISEAKADEITNLEREIGKIEAEMADWSSRLGSAQRHIDARIGAARGKRVEFDRIRNEVEALVASLPSEDRGAVYSALEGELQDLQTIVREADKWVSELTIEASTVPLAAQRAMQDQVQSVGRAGLAPAAPGAREATVPASASGTATAGAPSRMAAQGEAKAEEPPVVYRDSEVREMLSKVPIERAPEEELTIRLEKLQRELVNRENTIMTLERNIERLLDEKEGSTTAVDLERNKIRLELAHTQEELGEKQHLLEQYLDVIRTLEDQMAKKDRELKETLELNRRKTDELKHKEEAFARTERELLEKQEEFRAERQELQDREARLAAQIHERESHEREIAKKELTLELRSEQVRKKMDRLTVREIELQRLMSQHKELEETYALKERELQNLRAELDVREEELRRRDTAVEERSQEAKKLQSELGKMEHRLRSRDEQLKRREGELAEVEARTKRIEGAHADREVALQAREEDMGLREAEVEGARESLEGQRGQLETARKQLGDERQEIERLRMMVEKRQEELLRREDQLGSRETTLRERERACQIREERMMLERKDIEVARSQGDEADRRWAAKEKALLDQLQSFNKEKQELLADWGASKKRMREIDKEKQELAARLLAAETSAWAKDEELLALARKLEDVRTKATPEAVVALDDGTKVALRRVLEDLSRQRGLLGDVEGRMRALAKREEELAAEEDILAKERERVQELSSQQQGGEREARKALEEVEARARDLEGREARAQQAEATNSRREAELLERERAVREGEERLERVATAQGAEARAEDREEELVGLQSDLESRLSAVERQEEEQEARAHALAAQETDLARTREELESMRENLLRAGPALGEARPPAAKPATKPTAQGTPPTPARKRTGLASKAADKAAATAAPTAAPTAAGTPARPAARPPSPPSPPPPAKAPSTATILVADLDSQGRAPVARLRCRVCGTVIPIYTHERPVQVACPKCGKVGNVK